MVISSFPFSSSFVVWGSRVSRVRPPPALQAVRLAAHHGHQLAALVGDADVVDAGTSGQRDFAPLGGEHVAFAHRREKLGGQAGSDRHLVVTVAGIRKGGIGQRGDDAAVADGEAIEHVTAHDHLHLGVTRRDLQQPDAEILRAVIVLVHAGADGLGHLLRVEPSGEIPI